jgi:hypothetical protein
MKNDEYGNNDYLEVFDVFDNINNTTTTKNDNCSSNINEEAADLTSVDNSYDSIFASLELLAGTCIVNGTTTIHHGGVDNTIFRVVEEAI